MLKVQSLTVRTLKGRTLLRDFSFVLNDRDKCALIGEEGNGKSTLLKILAGVDVSDYAVFEGKIQREGNIGYLSQRMDEYQLDMDPLHYLISDQPLDYTEIYGLFRQLNIDPSLLERESMRHFSGGEKVKFALARLLYARLDILLLDEPTNDLDLKTLLWLEEFIKTSPLSILFISHDETLLENCAESVLHLEQLKKKSEPRITYSGENYRSYAQSRLHMIERTNSIAAKEKSEWRKQMEKWRRIYQKVDHAQKSISRGDPHGARLLKKKMHSVKALEKNLSDKKEALTQKYEPEEAIDVFFEPVSINPHKIILDWKNETLSVQDRVLVKSFDLHIEAGHKICFIGDNGCGKSTLLKKIWSELKERTDIHAGYMPQNYDDILPLKTDPVSFLLSDLEADQKSRVMSFLGALKFTEEEMSHPCFALSEGQKAKIVLLKLILDRNDVLLLDEPTRNLSPLSNPRIRAILNEYQGCIISVSHDRKFLEEVANRICEVTENGLVFYD